MPTRRAEPPGLAKRVKAISREGVPDKGLGDRKRQNAKQNRHPAKAGERLVGLAQLNGNTKDQVRKLDQTSNCKGQSPNAV